MIMFHLNLLPCMFSETEIKRSMYYFDINYSIVPMAAKNCTQNSEILKE